MSETWVNVYEDGTNGAYHKCPERAEYFAYRGRLRVEHRINGRWHRPPVGMRGRDASHYRRFVYQFDRVADQLVKR